MRAAVATEFDNKSVAEQKSIVLAWSLLMEDRFQELRKCIFATSEERRRFRQFVVNAVIATDIADKELKNKREARWDAAFLQNSESTGVSLSKHDMNRRATVIFEYIIQASDIAHCMQHWLTYQRFNRRLFEERYLAWITGHSPKEPSQGWYKGELWFFDNYIIPLAKKLHKCGVFGVSYYEMVAFAEENRLEWEQKGQDIVPVMLHDCQAKYGSDPVAFQEKYGTNPSTFFWEQQSREMDLPLVFDQNEVSASTNGPEFVRQTGERVFL